jgi:hypothetical protein
MSSNGEKADEMSTRWIDTIKSCVTQQTEQRRGLFRRMFYMEISLNIREIKALGISRIPLKNVLERNRL